MSVLPTVSQRREKVVMIDAVTDEREREREKEVMTFLQKVSRRLVRFRGLVLPIGYF